MSQISNWNIFVNLIAKAPIFFVNKITKCIVKKQKNPGPSSPFCAEKIEICAKSALQNYFARIKIILIQSKLD
jgi:hypothetical protein